MKGRNVKRTKTTSSPLIIFSLINKAPKKLHRLTAIFLTLLLLISVTEVAILGFHIDTVRAQEQATADYIRENGEKPAEKPKDTKDKSTTNKLPGGLKQNEAPDYQRQPSLEDKKLATPSGVTYQTGVPTPSQLPAEEINLRATNTEVQEIVEERDSHKKVIQNTDGTVTEKQFFDAVHYQENGQWKNVDTKLVEDTNAADTTNTLGKLWGKVRSGFESTKTHKVKANDWKARFAPSNDKVGMVRIQFKGGTIAFKPVGARNVKPQISTNADGIESIKYAELWKNVDVEYQVQGDSLKEYILLKDKSVQNDFEFEVVGAELAPDPDNPGGFKIKNQLDNQFGITPIYLIRQDAGPIFDNKLYEQKYENGKLKLSVNRDYVNSLPAAAFPLIIDPSTHKTSSPASGKYRSYKSDGASCGDCMYTGSVYHDGYWRDWRATFNIPHNSMVGKDIIAASLHVKNTTTSAPYGSSGAWVHTPYRLTCTTSATCIDTDPRGERKNITTGVAEFSIKAIMQARIAANNGDTWMVLVGDERNDHTFKHLIPSQTWVTFTYSARPKVPTSEVPSTSSTTEVVVTTTEPQIGVKHVTDSDDDDVDYGYYVANEQGNIVYQTGWLSNNRLTIPDGILEDTGKYTWFFRIKDPYWASAWTQGGKFVVDLRTGKDKTSTYDEVGPVSVNLNTGNTYTSTDTHSVEALGGSIGLNLHYNSPLMSKKGLTAEYFNNRTLTGNPVLRRTEATINNNWSRGSPSQGVVNTNDFSARYSGYFIAPRDGTYYFSSNNDDALTIHINNSQVYYSGICSSNCGQSTPVTLKAGEIIDFRVDYAEHTSVAYASVYVQEATAAPSPIIIPTDWLRTKPKPTDSNTGLMGHYYYDDDGTHNGANDNKRFLVRQDPAVNYSWATTSPIPGGPTDKFYVRWTGYFTAPMTGTYYFGATSDDGSKVTVNNALTYTAWETGPNRTGYGTMSFNFTAGQRVPIMVEYFETSGNAGIELLAKGPHNPSGEMVLPEYLSPGDDFLPAGWELSGDSSDSILFERIEVKQSGDIDVIDADGSKERFKFKDGGFKAPANVEATLIKNSDDSYTLTDASGMVYVFNVDGTLRETISPVDEKKPAALKFNYQSIAGSRVRLKEIIDPVDPVRKGTLYYAGEAECDESGFDATPPGMLCAFVTYDGRKTVFKYTAGRLARVIEPGNLAVDYSYDTNGMLANIRSSESNDAVAAGVRANNEEVLTEIGYDNLARATNVKPPAANPGSARNKHVIDYLPNSSKRHVENTPEPNGYLQYVAFDNLQRTTTSCDEYAKCTLSEWHPEKDLLLSTTDPLGLKSTTIYSEDDLPFHKYGPAPKEWFGADRLPLPEHASKVPHSETRYDEGMNAPAVAYYDVKKFDNNKLVLFGGPKLHKLGNHNNANLPGQMQGDYNYSAPYTKSQSADGLGMSATGRVTFPGSATYILTINHDDSAKVWLDDKLVIDNWNRVSETRENKVGTFTAVAGKSYKIRVDYANVNNQQGWYLAVNSPSLTQTVDWTNFIKPNYGLTTTTLGFDSRLGNTKSTSQYQDAALGLLGGTKLDPEGLNLETKATYEEHDQGYLRKLSKTLPGGNQTTYTYYGDTETADNPCTPAVEAFRQGGMAKGRVEPDPDGASAAVARTTESIYNDAGLPVATRIGNDPWTCTTYDERGRALTTVYPTVGNRLGRTIQNNYAYEGNSLKTMSSDAEGFVVKEVDLQGNEVFYRDTRGNQTTSEYNNIGQLIKRTSKLGIEEFTYNNYGKVEASKLDGVTLATLVYDEYGRIHKTSVNIMSGLHVYSGFYDELKRHNGQVMRLPDQADGGLNFHTEFKEYSPGGNTYNTNMTGIQLAGDGQQSYTYDSANRLTKARVAGNEFEYGFGAQAANCNSLIGNNPSAGKNSNRMTMTKNGQQSWYCYDSADRLIGASDDRFTSTRYDNHGNVYRMGKTSDMYTTLFYDQSDRNVRITEGTSKRVDYRRDVEDRVKTHMQVTTNPDSTTTTTNTLYGFTGSNETPDFVVDAAGTVVEKYLTLPSGITLTMRPTKTEQKDKIQVTLSDLSKHTLFVLDGNGQVQDGLKLYDPFGNAIKGTDEFINYVRSNYSPQNDFNLAVIFHLLIQGGTLDNDMAGLNVINTMGRYADRLAASSTNVPNTNDGSGDYGWAGSLQKLSDTAFSSRPIQMGARVYLPELGRFLSVDSIEGANENPYLYPANPVMFADYNGNFPLAIGLGIVFAAIVVYAVFSAIIVSTPKRSNPPVIVKLPDVRSGVSSIGKSISKAWDSAKSKVGTRNNNQRGYNPRTAKSIRFDTARQAPDKKRAAAGRSALNWVASQLQKGIKPITYMIASPDGILNVKRYGGMFKYAYYDARCRCDIHYFIDEQNRTYDDLKVAQWSR